MTAGAPPGGAVLLDTDAFSFLHRADALRPIVDGRIPLLSFVTVGELCEVPSRTDGERQGVPRCKDASTSMTVVPYDEVVVNSYAEATAWAMANGHPLGQVVHSNDPWIAATAVAHGVPLVSGNHRHFAGLPGLRLLP